MRLSIHERALIAGAYAMEFGRELSDFPELVEAWEDDAEEHEGQAFNRPFELSFSATPIAGLEVRSKACDVLPNALSDTLFITVTPDALKLLRVLFMGAQAPRFAYGPFATQVQPWWQECALRGKGILREGGVPPSVLERLRRCTEDASLFDMLRVMIVGERLCFFGQIGARTSLRAMQEAFVVREADRQMSIRMGEDEILAIDGFAPVSVVRSDAKVYWHREDGSGGARLE
jgi:hypothetical protein